MGIKENLTKVKEQIGSNKVQIIAVTKYATQEQISEAYKLGIRDFGENYIQDALEKISRKYHDESSTDLIKWHLIGRIQKNKIKYIVGKFCLIHSVDSFDTAELINKSAHQKDKVQNILLQVNISQEAEKAGFHINQLKNDFGKMIKLENIKVEGLMTIAPKTEDKEVIKDCFFGLKNLKNELNQEFKTSIKELSMGMSNDYSTAIEQGSTMIRLGRTIFSNEQQMRRIKN